MAIESVTSTTYTPPPQQPRTDQAAQATQAEQNRPATAREAEGSARDTSADQTQSAPPVVNAQGQMTGKVINTVA